jgi:hypothetical protein
MTTKAEHVIGIDPGEHTGVAVYSREARRLVTVETMDFWAAHDYVLSLSPNRVEVVVEVPGTFLYNAQTASNAAMQSRPARDRKAVNVGGVRMMGELLARRFESKGFVIRRVQPARAKKWDAAQFRRYTGWGQRTNSHERDAARLAFGL